MDSIFWLIISIAALVVLIAVVFIFLLLKKKIPYREPDYQVWFWIGVCWVGAGIPLWISADNFFLFIMGLIFLILSLVHKKDWKKNRVKWKNLTPLEKKLRSWIMIVLGVLILAGLIAFLMIR